MCLGVSYTSQFDSFVFKPTDHDKRPTLGQQREMGCCVHDNEALIPNESPTLTCSLN